ncbi:MAG TPA: (d)CMP kinase [Flavobacteriales bacterium]|nr:(d)CMP kinase [Flavobacteriales bacterium]HPH81458.1 (d)CMP kinase [Flavobacteriales bacterium]
MPPRKITIAIDGYSSCGKSTIARALAARLHYNYVDTGAMYRAVTLYALRNGLINGKQLDEEGLIDELDQVHIQFLFNPETQASEILLNDENVEQYIRQMDVNDWVSQVSAVGEVRRKMVKIQQELGKGKGIAMDGRDIGTTVFPDAELKIFMTAETNIRTQRRLDEMDSKGISANFEQVRDNLLQRDLEDMSRAESPLRKADDAIILDNSNLSREQQLDFVLKLVDQLTVKS